MPRSRFKAASRVLPHSRSVPSATANHSQTQLTSLEYDAIQVAFITANLPAAKAVIKYHLYLMYRGFTHHEIAEVASAPNGFKNISAIFVYYELLRERGLSNGDILREVLKPDGHIQLFSFITITVLGAEKSQYYLQGRGITPEDRKQLYDVLWGKWYERAPEIRHLLSTSEPFVEAAVPPKEEFMPEEVFVQEAVPPLPLKEELNLIELSERSLDELKLNVESLGFTYNQVSKISKPIGGSLNLRAVIQHYRQLRRWNFTHDQIENMVSRDGGSRNLGAVIKHYEQLRTWRFNNDQIENMVSRDGGSLNLRAVIQHYRQLRTWDFTHDQIERMVSHDGGGSRNLGAVIQHYGQLRTWDFTNDQIERMVSHKGGSRNLGAVIQHYEQLRTWDFSNDQIERMVSYAGGSLNLAALIQHYEQLRTWDFSNDQIERMVSHNGGGSLNLAALIQHYEQLRRWNFTNDQIEGMLSRSSGRLILAAISDCYESLIDFGFKPVELAKIIISHQSGGAKIIRAINSHFYTLVDEGLNTDEITELASSPGSAGRAKLMGYIQRATNVDQPEDDGMLYDFFPDYVPVSNLLDLDERAAVPDNSNSMRVS